LRSSISEGTSKIFDSVVAKKNGLFSDISSKLDSAISTRAENPLVPAQQIARERRQLMRESHANNVKNGTVKHYNNDGDFNRPSAANMSFDEPLYQRQGSKESIAEKKDPMEKTAGNQISNDSAGRMSTCDERDPRDPPFRIRRHSIVEDIENEPPYRRESIVEDFGFDDADAASNRRSSNGSGGVCERQLSPDSSPECAAESVEEISDLPETAQRKTELRKIIHAMGDLISFDDEAFDERRGSISSNSEYGGNPVYERSPSQCSDVSWNSVFSSESMMDEFSESCKEFMTMFVGKIFDTSNEIPQTDKAKFGEITQQGPGRVWFARSVNSQRVNQKKVDEQIFYRLVQYFAVVLFECHDAEDFSPAKSLMNMCFTFYYETKLTNGRPMKYFLYSYLRDQPIWQSVRFWNAAFFDAVQSERSRKPLITRSGGSEERYTDKEFQENITFGQLGTFTCNMRAFGLGKDQCIEFLRKQATIANLKDEQVSMLRENVERWREH
ncbi:uncharacterized protein LOC141902578, partial [Tubulanus polymorphus]|uniref:uncharacterized protein LOC141902578 n=1 Tax=Tubulanus polymorphus TaxID=672921 RepID=UPI003DA49D24